MKYTMEEFKKMYEEAEMMAIEKLDEDFTKATADKDVEKKGMHSFAFTMQNMLAMGMLKSILFKENKENEKEGI